MSELIAAYDELISLLAKSEANLLRIAAIHGYSTPLEWVRKGEQLRAKIAALKAAHRQNEAKR